MGKHSITQLATPDIQQNPWPTYADLRAHAPVSPVKSEIMHKNGVIVTRFDDVLMVYKDPRFSNDLSKNAPFLIRWLMKISGSIEMMLLKDDPEHKRLRNLVDKAFTPQMVENLTPRIECITRELIDKLKTKKQVDLVSEFSLPLPVIVISEILGIPSEDCFEFHEMMSKSFKLTPQSSLQRRIKSLPNMLKLVRLFKRLIKLRRTNPDDRLITALINIYDNNDQLSDREVLGMIFLLLFAGHETTVNLVSSGVLALLEYPDQFDKLKNNPSLIDSAIEEFLRYSSPVVYGASRFPTEDVYIGSTKVPKGTEVIGVLSSANRDETVFENADQLDITRNPNKHIAFGAGRHFCLGVWLARTEAKIAITALIKAFPNMSLAKPSGELRWRVANTSALRGLEALPIKLI